MTKEEKFRNDIISIRERVEARMQMLWKQEQEYKAENNHAKAAERRALKRQLEFFINDLDEALKVEE